MVAEKHLQPVPQTPVATPDLFTDERIKLIQAQTAKGAPQDLFLAMIEIARTRGLDPLAKQISLINFGGTWQITTTIDGYRALAERTGAYAGSDEPRFELNDQGKPTSASVTVWKLVGGQRVPFTAKVYFAEYKGKAPIWNDKPFTMISKVAESHALRKAFPATLSGVYTADEMEQAGPIIDASSRVVDAEVIDVETGEIIEQEPRTKSDHETAMRALHATAAERFAWTHDELHIVAVAKYKVESLKDLTADQLAKFTNRLKQLSIDESAKLLSESRKELAPPAEQPEIVEAEPAQPSRSARFRE